MEQYQVEVKQMELKAKAKVKLNALHDLLQKELKCIKFMILEKQHHPWKSVYWDYSMYSICVYMWVIDIILTFKFIIPYIMHCRTYAHNDVSFKLVKKCMLTSLVPGSLISSMHDWGAWRRGYVTLTGFYLGFKICRRSHHRRCSSRGVLCKVQKMRNFMTWLKSERLNFNSCKKCGHFWA